MVGEEKKSARERISECFLSERDVFRVPGAELSALRQP